MYIGGSIPGAEFTEKAHISLKQKYYIFEYGFTILEMLAWTPICPKDKRLSTLDIRVSTVDIRLSKLRVNI